MAIAVLAPLAGLMAGQMGFAAPAYAAECTEPSWEGGAPVFKTDCERRSALAGASTRSRGQRAGLEPLNDLRKNDIPFRSNFMLDALEAAVGRYKAVVSNGGWPKIRKGRYLRPGKGDERVPRLRQRLIIAGDLDPRAGTRSESFDATVVAAVKRFQRRHGLRPNGVIGTRTLANLNVSAAQRLSQLRINYRRISELMVTAPEPRYVLVNIPAFQLEAVDGQRAVQRHRVIVGKRDRQTPSLKATIRGLNFFPYWRVPDSIAHRDLIPRLQKEPDYLDKEYIRVLDGFGGSEVNPRSIDWTSPDAKKYKFRQDPGGRNALGLVRIDMPNEHIVYMHDTPMKRLFKQRGRSFSAGCVRVENVFSLARWIASGEEGWDRNRIDEVLDQGVAETLKLTKRVPVYFSYITAWVDPNGPVQFRYDLYGRDITTSSVAMAAGDDGGLGDLDGPPVPRKLSP